MHFLIPVALPKSVVVTDKRLGIFYYATLLSAIVGLCIILITSGHYYRYVPTGESWVVGLYGLASAPAMQEAWQLSRSTQLCTSPGTFDFVGFDGTENETSLGHSCAPACPELAGDKCISAEELVVPEGEDQLLVITHLREGLRQRDGTVTAQRSYFLPFEEAISITLSRVLPAESSAIDEAPGLSSEELPALVDWSGALVVLLDSDSSVLRVVEPSDSITITVRELLDLSGIGDTLNQPNVNVAQPGLAAPIRRITGMRLDLRVSCFNYQPVDIGQSWDGHLCYVSVAANEDAWQRASSFDAVTAQGDAVRTVQHGLRIRVHRGGHFRFVSTLRIMEAIVMALVLLRLPKQLLAMLAVRLLGQLSVIYDSVLYERFDLREAVGGITARVLASGAAFLQLQDAPGSAVAGAGADGAKSGTATISRAKVAERLRQVLTARGCTSSTGEVEYFINTCFSSLAADDLGKKPATEAVDIECFSHAYNAQELVGIEELAKLFDREASARPAQSFLWPPHLSPQRRRRQGRPKAILPATGKPVGPPPAGDEADRAGREESQAESRVSFFGGEHGHKHGKTESYDPNLQEHLKTLNSLVQRLEKLESEEGSARGRERLVEEEGARRLGVMEGRLREMEARIKEEFNRSTDAIVGLRAENNLLSSQINELGLRVTSLEGEVLRSLEQLPPSRASEAGSNDRSEPPSGIREGAVGSQSRSRRRRPGGPDAGTLAASLANASARSLAKSSARSGLTIGDLRSSGRSSDETSSLRSPRSEAFPMSEPGPPDDYDQSDGAYEPLPDFKPLPAAPWACYMERAVGASRRPTWVPRVPLEKLQKSHGNSSVAAKLGKKAAKDAKKDNRTDHSADRMSQPCSSAPSSQPEPELRMQEWQVIVDHSFGTELGIVMSVYRKVEVVKATGLIPEWNGVNPNRAVRMGDVIREVNGRQRVELIVDEMRQERVLRMTVAGSRPECEDLGGMLSDPEPVIGSAPRPPQVAVPRTGSGAVAGTGVVPGSGPGNASGTYGPTEGQSDSECVIS